MSQGQRRSSRLLQHSLSNSNSTNIHKIVNTAPSHYNDGYSALSHPRPYALDTDVHPSPFANMNVDYDPTEGAGGLSVSSYDSIDDDRSPVDIRGYPYHDQILPYSTHSLYPPIPYTTDEIGHASGALTPSDVSSSISPPNGQVGNTKYSTAVSGDRIASALSQEEQARRAEEDRRRRNTAASARFRMKKKQREQTLERTVRETTERNATLEARVAQLEMENRWLKNLVTEKHEASAARMAMPPEDNREMNRRINSIPGSGQKHIQPKKKGVGTNP